VFLLMSANGRTRRGELVIVIVRRARTRSVEAAYNPERFRGCKPRCLIADL
jgi:hypothetical protein